MVRVLQFRYYGKKLWKRIIFHIDFYANRERSYDEVFPWDHIDVGVSKKFLIRENEKAKSDTVTADCRHRCNGMWYKCTLI